MIAAVRDRLGEPIGDAEPTIGLGQQHDTTVRTEAPAIEGSGYLFARDGWKRERQQGIVGHGGRGALRSRHRVGFNNRILRQIKCLCYVRRLKSAPVMNKTG